jgi:hypothetical protein
VASADLILLKTGYSQKWVASIRRRLGNGSSKLMPLEGAIGA